MSRTVWFNCCAGVAGDMLLASLVDAGADRTAVIDAWTALGVDGFEATWEQVQRCGVRSLWTNIAIDPHHPRSVSGHDHPHRPAGEVLDLIASAPMAARVRDRAFAVYRTLADVEGAIHGVDADEVELHEVGALDSILDVVGVCAALHTLGIERITYSPIAVGHGTVTTAHGELPNPVPAVTALLARAGAVSVGIDTAIELATPTGVALVTVLGDACGPMPPLMVAASGFGAGTADPPGRPNVVQAIVGESSASTNASAPGTGRPARLVEVNVDDVTGEVLAHTIASLLAAGAHDAWVTPIVMKKGRAAHTVHALCDDATSDAVIEVMLAETGSLGIRASSVDRWPQQRDEHTVNVDGYKIRVKVAKGRIKIENDDAAIAAQALNRPLRTVIADAEHAAASLANPIA